MANFCLFVKCIIDTMDILVSFFFNFTVYSTAIIGLFAYLYSILLYGYSTISVFHSAVDCHMCDF